MNEDFWLIVPVAIVWALLALAYALAPWGDMIGYAWVWGFGSVLFAVLAALLARCAPPTTEAHRAGTPTSRH
jgi:hypothetical protein